MRAFCQETVAGDIETLVHHHDCRDYLRARDLGQYARQVLWQHGGMLSQPPQ